MLKKIFKAFVFLFFLIIAVYFLFFSRKYPLAVITHSLSVGDSLDSFNGVTVYNNGTNYSQSYGRHYSSDSFYYGKKWQCVEFIKRYYHDYIKHDFPLSSGHAKDFFDESVRQGKMNKKRGLIQYCNGENEKPKVNDILVFGGNYGHVAIISHVGENELEVIQQNIYMTPRQTFSIKIVSGKYFVGETKQPLCWLRKE